MYEDCNFRECRLRKTTLAQQFSEKFSITLINEIYSVAIFQSIINEADKLITASLLESVLREKFSKIKDEK